MESKDLFTLLREGKVDSCQSVPKMVETVISRVFIFDQENLVLKFYKRDNDWWNTSMQDMSSGVPRANFIRQDFAFNHFLNPNIYTDLKCAVVEAGRVTLRDPEDQDDELVIVMKKQDFTHVLTQVLAERRCTLEDYRTIGKSFAHIKQTLPSDFLPKIEFDWYEHVYLRLNDLTSWVTSEKDFPSDVGEKALERLRAMLEQHKDAFKKISHADIPVSIDSNSENLLYENGELSFIDAYPPKDAWRVATFEGDIFRIATDIYVFAGEEAYDTYMSGVQEVAPDAVHSHFSDFYILYSALIAGPYFFMLTRKNPTYRPIAEKYLSFIESLLN